MKISELFERCLSARYRQVGASADFAIEREGETLYLFFQKSVGTADWENNLDFPAKPYARMEDAVWYAHRGFLRVWKSAEDFLAPAIVDKSIRRMLPVGYSHGAALAVLCHEYIRFHRPDAVVRGYGFGCPRVVWGPLPKEVKARWKGFTVVRNIDDVVTHLPPAALGYRHVGKLLEIGKKGTYSDLDAHRAENILKELKKGGY